ncbi:MAG: thiamine-phosphate kinase [Acidobacteria bacterium]|jgi:thiamine-monophosphate kinase|nr:thiamine-phosphate kinase [Acidobacteriota bacterium]
MLLSELGEEGLLRELERRGLARGVADDTALVGDLVVTQDALVEGVHFRLDAISWRDLGWRAAAVNLSDLAAAGASPEALVVTLAAPRATLAEDVFELYEGIRETSVAVVGGDTTEAAQLVLSVTALGHSDRVPGRGGALPGDVVVVTGPLGASGAAFRTGGYVRPPLRLGEGRELAAHAHALMDVSDGLGVDCRRLADASGCAVVVDLERVPLAPGALLRDLSFGEDYELLAAVRDAGPFTPIGRCVAGTGVSFRLHGEPFELAGWQHFAS